MLSLEPSADGRDAERVAKKYFGFVVDQLTDQLIATGTHRILIGLGGVH